MDVADIHAQAHNIGGWLLVIEGCATMFTNIPALAGSGASSWIGTGYGAREVKYAGADMCPSELPFGETDPWQATIRHPTAVAFSIVDFDGSIAALFVDWEDDLTTDTLGGRLSPLDDPAPDPGVGLDGEVITLWDRDVGIEHIGPEGERRHFWLAPDDVPPGLDHTTDSLAGPPSRVTDSPSIWAGRKCAIYRIVQDPDTGAYSDWDAQYAGGSLWWYGTVTDRGEWKQTDKGRAFVLYATGPSSWAKRTANMARPTQWHRPTAGLILTGDELLVSVWIEPIFEPDLGDGIGGTRTKYRSFTLRSGHDLTGLTTVTEIWSQIRDIAYSMIDGSDNGTVLGADAATWIGPTAEEGVWRSGAASKRDIRIAPNGSLIEIVCEGNANYLGFRLGIAVDARVWQLAGWDINGAAPKDDDENDIQYLAANFGTPQKFGGSCPVGGALWGEADGAEQLPEKHIIALFSTQREGYDDPESAWDNGGKWQSYKAPYADGCIMLDHDRPFELFLGMDTVQCEGQHGVPFTKGAQIDGTDVDSAGWWLFRGPRLTAQQYLAGDLDAEEYAGVAFCEWVATSEGDAVEINDVGQATIRVVRWEDPRAFGLPFDPLDQAWVGVNRQIECAPIAVLGGTFDGAPGWRHRIVPTALLSSGTAVWDDSGDIVTITAGDNQPGDIPAEAVGDIEVADLGCGLPAPFVDWASWYRCASTLPGGTISALNRVRYVLFGSRDLFEVMRDAMAGAGWAWSIKRTGDGVVPAFGAYDPLRLISPDEVVATLTREDMAELSIEDRPQWRGSLELRRHGPFDLFEFEVNQPPLDIGDAEPYKVTHESLDPGRRHRGGQIPWLVKDAGLRDPAPWLPSPKMPQGSVKLPLYDWTEDARSRFAGGFGPKLAKQLRIYRAVYNARITPLLGLGSPVHVVDSTCEAPDGTRGINHRGRVIECSIIAKGTGKAGVRVAIELERLAVDQHLVWGPCGLSGVEGFNDSTDTVTLAFDGDFAGLGDSYSDVTGFTRPSWTALAAGDLAVYIVQSEDGETWPAGLDVEAEVAAVNAGAGTIELANIVGTLLEDTIKVIVAISYDDQTATWGALFAPTVAPNALYNGADKGFRLK